MEKVKLLDICNPKQWKTIPTGDLLEEGYPVYGANGIIGYYSEYNHETPVIAVTCRGATCGSINITVPNAYVTGNAMCLDDIRNDVNINYLYYCLKHYDFNNVISGSAQPQITRQGMDKIFISICCHDKQCEIVDRLKKIENVIDLRKREIELLDSLIKARFVEMFGDPVMNEKDWPTKPLLDMGQCKNGMNFHYDDEGVEINCLGVGDFKDFSVINNTDKLPKISLKEMPSEEYLLKDDDIVFVRSNGNKDLVGRSIAVYPGDIPTTFSGFCIRYRKHDNEITVPYLLRVLKADSMRVKMTGRGANIQNLNQQILRTLVIPVPPIQLQNQFADFVHQVDKSKFVLQKMFQIIHYSDII
ncbi:MAG: restriction endonuclease subunit S [Lachnospiraceae bacterium]|nr:restriction endonuclease subunit S [Lachnospiraceae bacterium]